MPRRQQQEQGAAQPDDLQQLLQLAQLQEALSGPQQHQQELAQHAQQAKVAAAVQLLGLHQQLTEGNADRQVKLQSLQQSQGQFDVGNATEREKIAAQDRQKQASMQLEAMRNENNITDAMLRDPQTAQMYPGLALKIAAKTHPAVAAALDEHKAAIFNNQLQQHIKNVSAVLNKPDMLNTAMAGITDPRMQAAVKGAFPQLQYSGQGSDWGDAPTSSPLDMIQQLIAQGANNQR